MTTESKKRTITLTGRAPVTVVEDNWPVIAKGVEENNAYGPGMTPRPEEEVARTTMRVRQHKDGRAIVYVTVKDAGAWCACTPGRPGGKMLAAGSDLALEITRVGALCDVSDEVIRECVAALPAVEVDERPAKPSREDMAELLRPVQGAIMREGEKRGLMLGAAEARAFAAIGFAAGADFVNDRR